MGLVAAKCTQCGASIEVDESKEAGICPYCGTAFITEKAINNFVIHNHNTVNNNIQHATINVKNGEDAGDYVRRYRAFLKQKKHYSIVKLLDEMGEKFPDSGLTHLCQADFAMMQQNYDGWLDLVAQGAKDEVLDNGEKALDISTYFNGATTYDLDNLTEVFDAFDKVTDDEICKTFKKTVKEKELSKQRVLRLIVEIALPSIKPVYEEKEYFYKLGLQEIVNVRPEDQNPTFIGYDSALASAKKSLGLAEDFLTDDDRVTYADWIQEVKEKYTAFEKMNERLKFNLHRIFAIFNRLFYKTVKNPHKRKLLKFGIRFIVFAAAAIVTYLIVRKIL